MTSSEAAPSHPPRALRPLLAALALAFVLAPALPPRPAAAQSPDEARAALDPLASAREAVARAQARFEAGDFRSAALEFERAYGLLEPGPSRNAVLNNLAVCQQRLHRHAEALQLFERYLSEADPLPEDRREVERIVEGLRDLVGELHVRSNVPADVWVDEQPRGRTPLTLQLTAGEHVLELRADGRESHRSGLTIGPRGVQELEVTLREPDVYHGAPPVYFYSGVALTSASFVVASALGARAVRLHRDAESRAAMQEATVADEAHIHRLTVATDVMLATGALLGVGTLVLGFLTDFERAREPRDGQLAYSGGVTRRGGFVTVGGTF